MASMTLQFVLELVNKLTAPARDATKDLSNVKKAANEINGGGFPKLTEKVKETNEALKENHSRLSGIKKIAIEAAAAYGGMRLFQGAWLAGSNARHQEIDMITAGYTPEELAATQKRAAELSTTSSRNFSQTAIEQTAQAMRGTLGENSEALKFLPKILDLKTIAQAKNVHGSDDHAFAQVIKALEIAGVTQDTDKMNYMIDTIAKSAGVFGETMKMEDWFTFFKRAGTAATMYDPDFIRHQVPTMIQEMGGDSAGTMLATLNQMVAGGRMSAKSIKAWEELGALDPTKVHHEKGGRVVLDKGALKDQDTAMHNPYQWAQQTLKPMFDALKLDDAGRDYWMTRLFPDRTASRAQNMMIFQDNKFDKDASLIDHAKGATEAAADWKRDPFVAIKSLLAQLENLMRVVADPLIGPAVGGLNLLTAAISKIVAIANDFPIAAGGLVVIATALGGLAAIKSLGWIKDFLGSGAALTASAGELTGAAAALTEAAGVLAGRGAVTSAVEGTVATSTATAAGAGVGGGGLLARLGLSGLYGLSIGSAVLGAYEFIKRTAADLGDEAKHLRGYQKSDDLGLKWQDMGDRERIYANAHRAQEEYKRDPEAARGRSMMRNLPVPNVSVSAPVAVSQTFNVDVSGLATLILGEVKRMVSGTMEKAVSAGTAALHDGHEMHGAH